jgi:hypothetical protein
MRGEIVFGMRHFEPDHPLLFESKTRGDLSIFETEYFSAISFAEKCQSQSDTFQKGCYKVFSIDDSLCGSEKRLNRSNILMIISSRM